MAVRSWPGPRVAGPRVAARDDGSGIDDGSAIIEFIFLAVVVMVPLIYLVLAAFEVQRNVFAVKQAAREAGRAVVTAQTFAEGAARADYAADLALQDQGLAPGSARTLSYSPAGAPCPAAGGVDRLEPGTDFAVCVTRPIPIPGVPGFLPVSRTTVTGRYVVHVDQFRPPG
jgi:hypothetical protein